MMMYPTKEKKVKKSTKRALVSVLMFCSVVFGLLPQKASADVWGATIGALMMKQIMENIQVQIQSALLGTLKVAAIQMLNSKVAQLVGGSSGGQPLFITDFNEFLYQSPRQKTNLYMNDFFSTMTRGKGSSANYISSVGGSSLGGDYPSYLVASMKSVTTESGGIPIYTLDQSGGIDAFSKGSPRAFSDFLNPGNNPMSAQVLAEKAWQDKLATEQNLAQIEATSSGFRADKTNGVIVAPAATIEATFNNAADLPNKMIAAATNPGELLSGVVSAMANKLVSGLIQKGVGEVQSKISKEIRTVDNKISGALNSQIQQLGPAAQYMSGINKNVNVIIKTNTPAPPAAKGCAGSASGFGGC